MNAKLLIATLIVMGLAAAPAGASTFRKISGALPWTGTVAPHNDPYAPVWEHLYGYVMLDGEVWTIFVHVRVMSRGYYVGAGWYDGAWQPDPSKARTTSWWHEGYNECSPRIPGSVGPPLPSLGSSAGGTVALKKGDYALVFAIDSSNEKGGTDYDRRADLEIDVIAASNVEQWKKDHRIRRPLSLQIMDKIEGNLYVILALMGAGCAASILYVYSSRTTPGRKLR